MVRAGLLIVLVGPTAVGKTEVSLQLAELLGAEIVSADSRLIYRGMDIGTAKPSLQERERASHHLIDVVNPDQVLTLAEYQRMAYAAIDAIHQRGRPALLVGGTGQYVRAVVEGWRIPEVPPDPALRAELEAEARRDGAAALHQRLAVLDPVSAARIDYRNLRRVIRALEVSLLAGRPISELQTKSLPPYQIHQIGLSRPRSDLYARIDERIEAMLDAGLVDEVRGLLTAGYSPDLPAMTGLGYRQIVQYLLGTLSLDDSVNLLRKETRRFVRQQATWFRHDDSLIKWFDLCGGVGGLLFFVVGLLGSVVGA